MDLKKIALLLFISSLTFSCNVNVSPINNFDMVSVFNREGEITVSKPLVIEIPSPNKNERPEGTVLSAIVLHHTATSADAKSVGKFFSYPSSKVSSHYIVDKTGYIVQSVPDNERAWHAGKSQFSGVENVNNFSIGIEICNIGDNTDPYPDTEYDAVIRLVAFLVKEYNIPLSGITRHRDIALPAGRKVDTSNNFIVQRVLDGVQAVLSGTYVPPVSTDPPPASEPNPVRQIVTKNGENTFKAISDIYLDNESRWNEIKYLNPEIKSPDNIPAGTKVKIPTTYKYFFELNNN